MKQEETSKVLKLLYEHYPNATTALRFSSPLECLVATILSAQANDRVVNKVTEELFKKYKTARDYARAAPSELAQDISKINFYKNKANFIVNATRMIVRDFNGAVPDKMEDLIKLPGVSRKTANVVLACAFKRAEGIVVDTHVMRVSQRLGLTKEKQREKIEEDLMRKIPRQNWGVFPFQLIELGRGICKAPKPRCYACFLTNFCRYYKHALK